MFIGVIVSLLVQFAKKKLGTTSLGTLILLAAAALGAAIAVHFIKAYGFYDALLQVLVTAGAFYSFIIRVVVEDDKLTANGFKVIK